MSEFSFLSTGNAEQDEAMARDIRRSMDLRDRGLCPNDETPMEDTAPHTKECPQCGFVEVRSVLYVGERP